jgi:hypothetical protein
MHQQIQPREIVPPRSKVVQEEIRNFLRAIDSYPARVAKEPRVSFHQHLCSLFTAAQIDVDDGRFDDRTRRE